VYRLRNYFIENVIPDLPMPKRLRAGRLDPESSLFNWIPAGVYPVVERGENDTLHYYRKEVLDSLYKDHGNK